MTRKQNRYAASTKKKAQSKRSSTRSQERRNPTGILRLTRQGYGFVQTAEGEYFIPASKLYGALDGDRVEIIPVKDRFRARNKSEHMCPCARIRRVTERANESIVGHVEIADPFAVIIPENPKINFDIFTLLADCSNLKDGDVVRVKIESFPSRYEPALGKVEEVIGHKDAPGLDIELIIARYKLETSFSEQAHLQAATTQLDEFEALAQGYKDLRHRCVFTIDPHDAKDFDDALSLERTEAGWRLGVHIADVSHYVPWGSALDLDARRRATSSYLVDRVIPMLPPELSDDLCSLRPHETRRSFTVDIYFDEQGNLQNTEFYKALICSKARLNYDEVLEVLQAWGPVKLADLSLSLWRDEFSRTSQDVSQALQERIVAAGALSKLMHQRRKDAGSLDFETCELRVVLDEQGEPVDIVKRQKNEATSLVEEAMILANALVAQFLEHKCMPCPYRVHEAPDFENLEELYQILQEFDAFKGVSQIGFISGDPKILQEVLDRAVGHPAQALINSLMLRAMKRAVYKPENEGHYGLALAAYAHFTSPIRRYPDLIVHRMLGYALGKKPHTFEQESHSLAWLCEHASKMERIAEDASRASQEMKIIEYMQGYLGQRFEGVITGMANSGLFVTLDNGAEGMLPVRHLGDEYFTFDSKRYVMTGTETGKSYRLGDSLNVRVFVAEPAQNILDFVLA